MANHNYSDKELDRKEAFLATMDEFLDQKAKKTGLTRIAILQMLIGAQERKAAESPSTTSTML